MAFSNVVIQGNLTADPDQRTTPSGTSLTSFSVAVNTRVGGSESTTYYNCTCWDERKGGLIAKYFQKGRPIIVSGSLSMRSYTGRDGSQRQSLDVNVTDFGFVGSQRDASADNNMANAGSAPAANDANGAPVAGSDLDDIKIDDIPF